MNYASLIKEGLQMSTSYWMIEGIGLRVLDVKPYINIEKAARFFHAQYPDDSDLAAMIAANDYSSFDLESFTAAMDLKISRTFCAIVTIRTPLFLAMMAVVMCIFTIRPPCLGTVAILSHRAKRRSLLASSKPFKRLRT